MRFFFAIFVRKKLSKTQMALKSLKSLESRPYPNFLQWIFLNMSRTFLPILNFF